MVRAQWGETVFGYPHIAEKAVANRGDGGDVARLVSVISKQTAQDRDSAGEGVFGDGGIVPDGVEEFVFW